MSSESIRFVLTWAEGRESHPIRETISIGRLRGQLNFPSDVLMSGKHAELRVEDGKIFVTDLGSSNGTLVNDQRLTPQKKMILSNGDRIQMGSHLFEMKILQGAEALAHPAASAGSSHGDGDGVADLGTAMLDLKALPQVRHEAMLKAAAPIPSIEKTQNAEMPPISKTVKIIRPEKAVVRAAPPPPKKMGPLTTFLFKISLPGIAICLAVSALVYYGDKALRGEAPAAPPPVAVTPRQPASPPPPPVREPEPAETVEAAAPEAPTEAIPQKLSAHEQLKLLKLSYATAEAPQRSRIEAEARQTVQQHFGGLRTQILSDPKTQPADIQALSIRQQKAQSSVRDYLEGKVTELLP